MTSIYLLNVWKIVLKVDDPLTKIVRIFYWSIIVYIVYKIISEIIHNIYKVKKLIFNEQNNFPI